MFIMVKVLVFMCLLKEDVVNGCPNLNCACTGTKVNCHSSRFTTIPANIPSSTTILDLSVNFIYSIAADAFTDLTKLIELNLSANRIGSLPKGLFSSNVNLKELYVSNNNLVSLPDDLLSNNTNLVIFFSNNKLESLPEGLLTFNTNLHSLELDRNNLGSLPEGLLTFNTNLEYLSLSGNNLVSLPEGLLSDKTNIRELYLSDNKFERTPEGLLTMLTLNTNRLELYLDKNPLMCCLIIELKELASKKTQLEVVGECTISNTTINIRDFKTSDCILPVDGGWSSWFNSSCSVSCGEGIRIQNRTCDNPPPSGSGQNCVGSENKTSVCNLGECPVDGGWSSWFNSSCSVSCGEGVRIRNRTCDNPSPTGSGQNCVGSETETSICNLGKCPKSCRHSKKRIRQQTRRRVDNRAGKKQRKVKDRNQKRRNNINLFY